MTVGAMVRPQEDSVRWSECPILASAGALCAWTREIPGSQSTARTGEVPNSNSRRSAKAVQTALRLTGVRPPNRATLATFGPVASPELISTLRVDDKERTMSRWLSRRRFIQSAAALAIIGAARPTPAAASAPTTLSIVRRDIAVRGKAATVYGIADERGNFGLTLGPGQSFAVRLENDADREATVHWHGQTPPPEFDGVAETGYAHALSNGEVHDYAFTPRPGTHWMHAHTGLLEQSLLAAPLIVRSAEDEKLDAQEVVVMLHDFSFRSPEELYAGLGGSNGMQSMDMGGMQMNGMQMGDTSMASNAMGDMSAMPMADLNDLAYDAYLANDRTLDDPQVVRAEKNGRVRLRIINAASATAFWLDFGGMTATLVATDGNAIVPFEGTKFPISEAQRLDFLLTVPPGVAVPVLAQREGDVVRTGIVLAPAGVQVGKIDPAAQASAAAADLSVEAKLQALAPLPARPANAALRVELTGSMSPYTWGINGQGFDKRTPLEVSAGQRVALSFVNKTMMMHPMHLHGHHFQIVGINGSALQGPIRDTALVPPMSTVDVAFDADNPGRWLFHCHNLYHMAAGMMGELRYV